MATCPTAVEGFAERFELRRRARGPLVFGLDPSSSLLRRWGVGDDADGLERFVDIAVNAACDTVGVVKPQSASYERHGWRGMRALARLVAECRSAGLLVILDAKLGRGVDERGVRRGLYGEAYFSGGRGLPVDAVTFSPYVGLGAFRTAIDQAAAVGGAVFVVTRSSNVESRVVQGARLRNGSTVECQLIENIGMENQRLEPGPLGPVGAVIGATCAPPPNADLRAMRGLFLAPGVGAQGATPGDVASSFASCLDRVLPPRPREPCSKRGPRLPA